MATLTKWRLQNAFNAVVDRLLFTPGLRNAHARLSEWYKEQSGYRKYGLLADDLIIEESDLMQEALSRLTPQQQFDRTFRFKRAISMSATSDKLPPNEWTKPEEDIAYLQPHIQAVIREWTEREQYDNLQPKK